MSRPAAGAVLFLGDGTAAMRPVTAVGERASEIVRLHEHDARLIAAGDDAATFEVLTP